ncbi:MAG: hypothetical protein OXU45_08595 [Candidatus Melainabacteria bacterium]|nr:hypothetical protein [Candidatus Melainabacteria bacterium]
MTVELEFTDILQILIVLTFLLTLPITVGWGNQFFDWLENYIIENVEPESEE